MFVIEESGMRSIESTFSLDGQSVVVVIPTELIATPQRTSPTSWSRQLDGDDLITWEDAEWQ